MDGRYVGVAITLADGRKLFLTAAMTYDTTMEPAKSPSRWWSTISIVLGFIVIIGSFYYFLVHASTRDPTSAALVAMTTFFMLGVLHIAMFASFEFGIGGLKATLRDATNEAKATTEQMRALGLIIGKAGMAALGGEYMGGVPYPERINLKNEITKALRSTGASELETKESEKWFTEIFAAHHVRRIIGVFFQVHGHPSANKPVHGYSDILKAQREFVGLGAGHRINPKEMRRRLEKLAPLTPEIEAELADYQHFMDTGTLRRPEEWLPKES